MVIVVRAVIRLTTVVRGLEFIGKRAGPFLPSKMSLLGKLDRERKRLRFPWLSEYRAARVARQRWEGCKAFGQRIRLVQGNHPTCRYRRHPAALIARPKVPAQKNGSNTSFAAFLLHQRRE